RFTARHARHADSEGGRARPNPWVWNLAAHPADLERRVAGAAGLAISRPAPAREAWLAQLRMARIRERQAGEILQTLAQRTKAVGRGAAHVAAAYRRHRADTTDCRITHRRIGVQR